MSAEGHFIVYDSCRGIVAQPRKEFRNKVDRAYAYKAPRNIRAVIGNEPQKRFERFLYPLRSFGNFGISAVYKVDKEILNAVHQVRKIRRPGKPVDERVQDRRIKAGGNHPYNQSVQKLFIGYRKVVDKYVERVFEFHN